MAEIAPVKTTAQTSRVSDAIAAATRRVRFLRGRQQGANGLMIGSALSAAVLLAERLRLLEPDAYSPEWLVVPPVLGLMAGILWGVTRPIPPIALLKHLETRLNLSERLSTALLMSPEGTPDDPFLARQVEDAETHAPSLPDLRAALPYTPVPCRVYYALGAVGATLLLWFLPTLPFFQSPAERAEKASLKRDGERLVQIAKKMAVEADTKKLDPVKKAAAKLAKLGEEMKKGRLTQQKAMMKAAELSQEMKQAQQALAAQTAPKSLPSAAREMAKAMAPGGNAATSEANNGNKPTDPKNNLTPPQAGAKQDGKQANSNAQQAMKQAVQAMSQNSAPSLAEQLSKMADMAAQNQPGDQAGREQMASQLSALADALKGTSYEAASQPLKEAADALKKGDMKTAAEKMREAARKVGESAQNSDAAQAMQQMAEAMQGQQDGNSMEGQGFGESGEGQGEGDAFDKNGQKKNGSEGHVHTAECLAPGGACNNPGAGGKGTGNGIGSGAGTPTTKKDPVGAAGAYMDPTKGPDNKDLNRATENHEIKDDQFNRIYAPDGKENNTRVTGKRGTKGKETVTYIKGAPDQANSKVPYYDVYGRYAPAAESAMNREDIPANYKKQVKSYFDSIAPDKAKRSGGKP